MQEGTVVWWDPFRGYGFLQGDDGQEYFVHNKAILDLPPGKRNLKKRERVTFDVGRHGERICAVDVRRLNPQDVPAAPASSPALALLGDPAKPSTAPNAGR